MDTFRFLLFGFEGVSVVFWVAIIALWHAYMFPRFFNEEKGLNSVINEEISYPNKPINHFMMLLMIRSNVIRGFSLNIS